MYTILSLLQLDHTGVFEIQITNYKSRNFSNLIFDFHLGKEKLEKFEVYTQTEFRLLDYRTIVI